MIGSERTQPMTNRPRRNGGTWKKALVHLFPVPALVFYVLFIIYPIAAAFGYSLYDWNGLKRGAFVGFDNFVKLFTVKPFNDLFWNALRHNVLYFIIEMIAQNGIAFLLAYVLYSKIKGAEWFKAAFFLPRLLSVIVVGFLWKLILNPNFGVLNVTLKKIGLASWTHPWLGTPSTALSSIILVNCWFGLGFAVLIFLAGLQAIPAEIVEAARLDGIRGWRLIRSVILPMSMHAMTIITMFTFIQAFEAFELVYAMQGSQGEPYHSTDTLAVYFYRIAFGGSSGGDSVAIGLGSALAVVMFAIIASLSAAYLFVVRRRELEL